MPIRYIYNQITCLSMQQFHLVKKDIDSDTNLEIATYHTPSARGGECIICKNEKRIGWASTEYTALLIHDMYTRIHILHETDDDPDYEAKIERINQSHILTVS